MDSIDSPAHVVTASSHGAGTTRDRFRDLRSAGRELALKLATYRGRDEVIVLAIALGGVPVAHEVSRALEAPLDLVIIRRLLAPPRPAPQVCAVNVAGTQIIDNDLPAQPAAPVTGLDYFIKDALAGLAQRVQLCRGERPSINLKNKTILLVDCGINTGSTMQASIRALRTLQPERIIAAAPVASPAGHDATVEIADEVICLAQPQPFGHVGLWYADFSRPGDDAVAELL